MRIAGAGAAGFAVFITALFFCGFHFIDLWIINGLFG